MAYVERAITFDCCGDQLVGVLTLPEVVRRFGVVVVVGGPQYRAGSHRQFVQLSRSLASHDFAVLRFDYRGMGDSEGERRDFKDVDADIRSAVDALLSEVDGLEGVVLWGLCDGASALLLYCNRIRDRRIVGASVANPWVRSEASLARAHVKHYYWQRLREPAFWAKLLRGQIAGNALAEFWSKWRLARARSGAQRAPAADAPFQSQMASAWRSSSALQLLLSGEDYTAKEFLEYTAMQPEWRGLLERAQVTRCDFPGSDHTFSDGAGRERLEAETRAWLVGLLGDRTAQNTG